MGLFINYVFSPFEIFGSVFQVKTPVNVTPQPNLSESQDYDDEEGEDIDMPPGNISNIPENTDDGWRQIDSEGNVISGGKLRKSRKSRNTKRYQKSNIYRKTKKVKKNRKTRKIRK